MLGFAWTSSARETVLLSFLSFICRFKGIFFVNFVASSDLRITIQIYRVFVLSDYTFSFFFHFYWNKFEITRGLFGIFLIHFLSFLTIQISLVGFLFLFFFFYKLNGELDLRTKIVRFWLNCILLKRWFHPICFLL